MTASLSALSATAGLLGWSPSATSSAPATAAMPSWSTIQGNVLSAVAAKLGMSRSDLTSQLKSGKSMADVAKANGLSSNDLTATIQSALAQSDLPTGISLGTMATRMANNVNNASIAAAPTPAPSATPTPAGLGIDTSSVQAVHLGSLSLDSSEVAMLLGTHSNSLDAYL